MRRFLFAVSILLLVSMAHAQDQPQCLDVTDLPTEATVGNCPSSPKRAVALTSAPSLRYYFRTSDEPWQSAVDPGVMKAEIKPDDALLLLGVELACDYQDSASCKEDPNNKSDTWNWCPFTNYRVKSDIKPNICPRALYVKITYKSGETSWHKLIEWKFDSTAGVRRPSVVGDLGKFFSANPKVRISINGKTPPIVDEVEETPGAQICNQEKEKEECQRENLANTKRQKTITWGGWGPGYLTDIYVAIYAIPDGCRYFDPSQRLGAITISATHQRGSQDGPNTGIMVGNAKIFDTFILRQKLATTASQLSAISPFSQAQITGQYGTLQGISQDISYIAAQLTTSPTPSVVTTLIGPTASQQTTTAAANTSIGTVQATCPPGFFPNQTATGTISCAQVTSGTAGNTPIQAGQTTITQNPATNQTVTSIAAPTNQVQTTIPSIQGTVPTAPTVTPLTAPSNVGVSASEMLSEQTQLSSELTTLQTLLQGATSDQLLLSNKRAIGIRAQTTIGFPVSIQTPQGLKGAVAEFSVLIVPTRGSGSSQHASQPVSIVNLLPSEKTYNVARVATKANQFGLGVATQPISFGITAGKSKNQLYLAKDADTVALQFPPGGYSSSQHDPYDSSYDDLDQFDNSCGELPSGVRRHQSFYDLASAVKFGWQFRPVLGAPAVAVGMRTLFAQLALPESDGFKFEGEVWIQTRWRRYDPKTQLVGEVYDNSCRWKPDNDPLAFDNPISIQDVKVTDEGQGILGFHGKGEFLSSTGQMRSGSVNVSPTYFDGYSIDYFGAAKDVFSNGDLQLLDEGRHGQSFVIKQKKSMNCQITNPALTAIPRPDGNSLVMLDYDRPDYRPDADGPQHPLLLIGTDVYGLRDKPLQAATPYTLPDKACTRNISVGNSNTHCAFTFLAPTDSITSARNFLVRDPAWDSQGVGGSISIDPTFTKIQVSSKPTSGDDTGDALPKKCTPELTCAQLKENQKKAKDDAEKPAWFLLSGTNLSALNDAKNLVDDEPIETCYSKTGCLQFLEDLADGSQRHVCPEDINLIGNDVAWMKLPKNVGGVHVFWSRDNVPTSEWDLTIKEEKKVITADPAVLYETDSRAVTFTGADFSKVKDVYFEGKKLDLVTPATKSKLIVQVTSAVTAKFGHKELTAPVPDDKDKTNPPKTIALPIDVVKH